MMKCNYIGENEYETFEKIVEEKYSASKTVLTSLKVRIESCYIQYLDRFEELETKPTSEFSISEDDAKRHLQGCYSSLTKTGIPLRASIFSNQPTVLKTLCPFCLLGEPKTLDHYIGQNEFPEYSFLVKNLIPCCYNCNQVKDIGWRYNYKRRFIHFYNDDFFENQFLFAELFIIMGIPSIKFSLTKPSGLDNDSFQIIEWHFHDLDLLQKYRERGNSLLSTEIKIMKDSRDINGLSDEQIKIQLQIKEKNFADDYGINYWQSTMYQCMSHNVNKLLTL